MQYLVTGTTGHLGSIVVDKLVTEVGSANVLAAVHTPAKAQHLHTLGTTTVKVDYLDVESMVRAFSGVDVLVYIPSKTYDILRRVTEFENTLTAMQRAGVQNIVYVSFFADQENNPFTMSAYYGYVPRRLAASGLRYAVMKNALYADPLVPYLPELIERKALIYPVGDQAMAFISQVDSAMAIVRLALTPTLRDQGQVYTVTQTRSWKMVDLGKLMTQVTGQQIGYRPVTVAEFARIYADEGDGLELGSMYAAGAQGLLDVVTDDFHTITGQQPESMEKFFQREYHKA